jgi:hypothetical protein
MLKLKTTYQGIVEDNLVPGLFDYLMQLYAWYKDQTKKEGLDQVKKDKLYILLIKKDDLFQSWQSAGTDQMPYLTSSFRSENHMQSAGINPQEKE